MVVFNDVSSLQQISLIYQVMETARTNETCIWSLTIDENAIEKPQRDSGSSSQPQTLLQNENASVVKSLVKWHKYLILFFTPILLMALPIAVPSSVR